MGLISFFKDAGEKLFGKAQAAQPAQPAADPAAANAAAAEAIANYIRAQNLTAKELKVDFDGASSTVSVSGEAADQATREKIILSAGNVMGVGSVRDNMTVATPAPEARYYQVKPGDTLSKIAKEMYGNANKYPVIFEANKPMLSNPDKIYPGQNLRIPPQ
jgi:nucleoid-associated protein YgaU